MPFHILELYTTNLLKQIPQTAWAPHQCFFLVNFHILMTNENHVQIAQKVFLDFVFAKVAIFLRENSQK